MESLAENIAKNSHIEEIEYAQYRARTYAMTSSVFNFEPTETALAELIKMAGETAAEACTYSFEQDLVKHFRNYSDNDLDLLRTRIASEYAELFIGPRPPKAPLYESLYRGSPNRLYTDVTRQVRDCYEQQGFSVAKRNKIPDDHLAYELEFLGRLCERQLAEIRKGDPEKERELIEAQSSFLNQHLAAWIMPFLRRVENASCSEYYRAWTQYVAEFIAYDVEYLAQRLSEKNSLS